MQTNEKVLKVKVKWDGEEIPGLINFAEVTQEDSTVPVPGFKKETVLSSEIEKINPLVMQYKLSGTTNTLKFFRKFYKDKEVKDLEEIRTDASGEPYETRAWTGCVMTTSVDPPYDASAPVLAIITVTVQPSARSDV